MIRIYSSAAASDRLTMAREFVRSFPPSREQLWIGASREAINRLAQSLSASLKATFGWHRFTLMQLAAHLATADFARRGIAHGTALGAEAVATRAVFEALDQNGLDYFGPVARLPGFARALASTLAELRLQEVDPPALASLGLPGQDLARLMRLFEEQFDEAAAADRTALLQTAAAVLDGAAGGQFRGWPLLFLDVPISSVSEQRLIRALLERASDALITVPCGDERTLAALDSIPGAEQIRAAEDHAVSSLGRLRSYLFSPQEPGEAERDEGVCFFSAPGEGRECTEIARRMLDEARRGTRFDQMAVLLRAPSGYAALLEAALARAEIPAYFTRGSRRPDPSGRAFLAILACAAERLSARRFAEYLSLAQVPQLDETGAPLDAPGPWVRADDEILTPVGAALAIELEAETEDGSEPEKDTDEAPGLEGTLRAPWNWERLLVEAAVIGGEERWRRRIGGLENEFRLKCDAERKEDPQSPRVAGAERELKNLGHLKAFALPVIERLAALPPQARWGEWLERLKGLAPLVLRRPERVLALLVELEPMDRVGPATLDEVRGVLAERLASLDRERPPRDYGRVFVGTPEQARGRSFAVVFVPGLAERIFPQRVGEDPILLDKLRAQLSMGLAQQDERVKLERLQLRLAAGAAERRIYFSYPRLEVAKARQRVFSFYWLDVQRATRGKLPRLKESETEARREAEAALAWPAPRDARHAIDDMEHDLAILGTLLRQQAGPETDGRARYLLELNSHLARSLRTRYARWRKAWSGADGLCEASEMAVMALGQHRLRGRPYSPTALQKFALCPYQFLLSTIHRLEPREEAVHLVQIDPMTRGSIFHRVLADFMRQLQGSGKLPVTLSSLAEAQKMLDQTLDRVAEKQSDELAPAILPVWKDGIEGIRTDLRGWLQRMAESTPDWTPIHFEFGIGFPPTEDRDPASQPEAAILPGGYRLHGIVDVIERRTGGEELRVTDYKTGRDRNQQGMIMGGGEVLQPVLYALAVEAAKHEKVSQGRLYFCTSAGGFSERVVELHNVTRQRAGQVLDLIDRAVERVFLPPAPKERACSWCDFREVCGPFEETRLTRKNQEPLDDLNTLRGLP
ncbi:MAG TPA: PD-(D/E)XK nuclease family protein [Terriglobia bacterium]|nr:PD-(D/E)XK nuclease family protein [Terriglobia bacterium]